MCWRWCLVLTNYYALKKITLQYGVRGVKVQKDKSDKSVKVQKCKRAKVIDSYLLLQRKVKAQNTTSIMYII